MPTGNYFVLLPARLDSYQVEIINLPAGFTIVIPGGGMYTGVPINPSSQHNPDHVDGVNFLLQGCGQPYHDDDHHQHHDHHQAHDHEYVDDDHDDAADHRPGVSVRPDSVPGRPRGQDQQRCQPASAGASG